MLLKGLRLIIPGELQEEYLSRLHKGHLSASKGQENAKQHMYWTGIDADIEDYTKRCQECIKRSQVPKEPLQPHDIPEGPWRKLGIDYFAFDGNSYVLICDYFSKIPFLYRAKTSFWSLSDRLIDLFSIEGYPDKIVSDNGPLFQSKEFAKFLSGLGIKHTTSSSGYPRSNGFIERHIQTVKNMLSKSSNTRSFQEVLADLRTTRIGTELPSLAEILHGRNLTDCVFYSYFQGSWKIEAFSLCVFTSTKSHHETSVLEVPAQEQHKHSFYSSSTNTFITCSLYTVRRYRTSPGTLDLWARLG